VSKLDSSKGEGLAIRAAWCGEGAKAANTPEAVAEYVERLHQARINALFVHLKCGHGHLFWPSRKFPEAVAPGYADFDLPAHLLKECRRRNMQLHAWIIEFPEGESSPPFQRHPEWAMLDPHGRPTNAEVLRGKQYDRVWMCPARRPGYVDQWLVPVIQELAELYDFDSIHHDYLRYPGDLAPDRYCFCDYCLERMPLFNGFVTERYPEEPFYHEFYDREYLEAHWEPGPRVLPGNWELLPRKMKADFLLHGSFFEGGLHDLDYFFYAYRIHWIKEFAREVQAAVRAVKPRMPISAALFKNPIHSGRFIGQDWRQLAPYIDVCVPMDYRDHFPGSFEHYLDLLEETIHQQKEWAKDYRDLWIGFAINFLYVEEERPLRRLEQLLPSEAGSEEIRAEFDKVAHRLRPVAPVLHERFRDWLDHDGGGNGDKLKQRAALAKAFAQFAQNVPGVYWPKEKLFRTIERIKSTGVNGISIFCEEQIERYGLWDAVHEAFSD
jgi:hypothetical protein